jgi:MFS family permease
VGWIFSISIAFLGLSAAFGGVWLEKVGPRKTMFVAAMCFGGGFFISSIGIAAHQIWLMFLGYGVIGGIGLGLGYVSPVSTLIKWFPDRKGLATGLAIMGFGGGALIASPLSVQLMSAFTWDNSNGVFETFLFLGFLYTFLMTLGSFTIRVPPKDWTPPGFEKSASTNSSKSSNFMNGKYVEVKSVLKTPQFYLLWLVLCMNVTAGIGFLGQASVMIQEVFKGQVSAVQCCQFCFVFERIKHDR